MSGSSADASAGTAYPDVGQSRNPGTWLLDWQDLARFRAQRRAGSSFPPASHTSGTAAGLDVCWHTVRRRWGVNAATALARLVR